ncbi:MAG: penicillin acylase family protein [Chromatiales bacterium]|jgi:penicillin G amidase|nr:penicillin acylase family protein [Chromatiales bacterium]
MTRKILLLFICSIAIVLFATGGWLYQVNNHQTDGDLKLPGLLEPVRVVRDGLGIPYVYANSLDDAYRTQGFLIAQDRLFQMEVVRHLSQGRLAELLGRPGLQSDIQMRVVGIPQMGQRHAGLLSPEARNVMELYAAGINGYIDNNESEFQLGLRVLGIQPVAWTVEDLMIIAAFTNWSSSSNMDIEIIAQAIIDKIGPALADEISVVSINPDGGGYKEPAPAVSIEQLGLDLSNFITSSTKGEIELGSNHWAISGSRNASGGAMLVNNPHIDSRTLPGIWYPMAIITPELRIVGAAGPGAPGFAAARSENIAYGVTNSYGDVIDLYIETVDPLNPDNYLEGGKSIPFDVVDETFLVRHRKSGSFYAHAVTIRYTRRGPVISDHGLIPDESRVIAMRWAAPEHLSGSYGLASLMLAKNLTEVEQAVAQIDAPYNYTVVTAAGGIAHFTAGRVPNRIKGDGSRPFVVTDGKDNWNGVIPAEDMPKSINPDRGWVGNANHRTLPDDYPYLYSTHFAHSWRYERMRQLLDVQGKTTAEEQWGYMRDVKNVMAEQVTPYLIRALALHRDTGWIVSILRQWDYNDDADAIAPLLFQAIYRSFVTRVFADDLGADLASAMLDSQYYWQERMLLMLKDNESLWFDDYNTFAIESRDDLIYLAAKEALADLKARTGKDPKTLTWGDLHTVTFDSPVVPGKIAAAVIGGGTFPKEGSGETMNRGKYKLSKAYDTVVIDSMRFVADMADPDKVMGVVAGGVSGRLFDKHLKDQLELWRTGEPVYWWYSDRAIQQNTKSELMLLPE